MGRVSRKAIFKKKLFEHNFVIIAVAIVAFGIVFLMNMDDTYCGNVLCDWDLGPFFYGMGIASAIVFLLEAISYTKLVIESPRKVNALQLLLVNFIILLVILFRFIITFGKEGIMMFLSVGFWQYDALVFIITTLWLKRVNR